MDNGFVGDTGFDVKKPQAQSHTNWWMRYWIPYIRNEFSRFVAEVKCQPYSKYNKKDYNVKDYPKDLIKAFVKVSNSGWSEKEYRTYKKLALEYLGKKSGNQWEFSKLTVALSRATLDMRRKDDEEKE
jgi:hypothetical protein